MEQVQHVRRGEDRTSSSKKRYGRYSKIRLDQAYKYAFEEFYGKTTITEHLSKLVEKNPLAGKAYLFLSLIQDVLLTKTGEVEEADLTESDEQVLFSNIPLGDGNNYFQPVVINDHVIGYLTVQLTDASSDDILLREMADAYSVLIARELEIMRQQRQFDVKLQQIAEREQELEKKQAYNLRLLSITSHDLKSPISAISGYVDLMGECIKRDGQHDYNRLNKYHRRIDLGLSEVMSMLKQFSDLSKIESGTISLDLVEVNLNWPVRKVCDLLESQAIKKDIDFILELSEEPAFVKADVVKLKRIVYNLVSNAIKYTPEGGRIVVKIAVCSDEIRLVVKDTGIGIRKRDQAKIFAPSVKLDRSKADTLSSGLGLYIASFFANLMDGAINVASKLQQGSLFTVKLPRVKVNK